MPTSAARLSCSSTVSASSTPADQGVCTSASRSVLTRAENGPPSSAPRCIMSVRAAPGDARTSPWTARVRGTAAPPRPAAPWRPAPAATAAQTSVPRVSTSLSACQRGRAAGCERHVLPPPSRPWRRRTRSAAPACTVRERATRPPLGIRGSGDPGIRGSGRGSGAVFKIRAGFWWGSGV